MTTGNTTHSRTASGTDSGTDSRTHNKARAQRRTRGAGSRGVALQTLTGLSETGLSETGLSETGLSETGDASAVACVAVEFAAAELSVAVCAAARDLLAECAERQGLRAVFVCPAVDTAVGTDSPGAWPTPTGWSSGLSAGGDGAGQAGSFEALLAVRELVEALATLPLPTVAVLHGPVTGEGLELALAADLRLASEETTFSLPYLAEGRLPACGGSQRLPRLVGLSAAFELFLGGEWDAPRAAELGLVNGIVPARQLRAEMLRWAARLAVRAPLATRFLKEALWRGNDLPLEQGLLVEEDLYLLLQTTEDRKEGIRAFLEKRRPQFKGG